MSFVAKILSEKSRVYDLRYAPEGEGPYYYFIQVDPVKEQAYLQAINGTEMFDLEDYGTILASGEGEPPAELKQEMIDKYKIQYQDA